MQADCPNACQVQSLIMGGPRRASPSSPFPLLRSSFCSLCSLAACFDGIRMRTSQPDTTHWPALRLPERQHSRGPSSRNLRRALGRRHLYGYLSQPGPRRDWCPRRILLSEPRNWCVRLAVLADVFNTHHTITALLVVFSPTDSVPTAWAGTLLTTSLVVAAIVQKASGQLTLHHATLVLK